MAEPGKDTRYRVVLGVGVGALVLDQLTKLWVMASLPYYGAVTVIPGFFDLVNIRNRGAAFGFLNRSDIEWQFWLFFAATLVSAGVIFMLARSAQRGEKLLFWGLGMVLGGAVGNLVDRIRFRAVVDFLDFYVGQWHWPAFNVADIAICCGALLVCLSMWLKGPSGRASWQIALLFLPALLNLWGIWHAFNHTFETPLERVLWMVACVFVPVLGGVAYVLFGWRRAH